MRYIIWLACRRYAIEPGLYCVPTAHHVLFKSFSTNIMYLTAHSSLFQPLIRMISKLEEKLAKLSCNSSGGLVILSDLSPVGLLIHTSSLIFLSPGNLYYEVSKARYLGLGKMYVEDERFTAYYEKYREGLAEFIYRAIEIYC